MVFSRESSRCSRGFERAPFSSIASISRGNLNIQHVRYEPRLLLVWFLSVTAQPTRSAGEPAHAAGGSCRHFKRQAGWGARLNLVPGCSGRTPGDSAAIALRAGARRHGHDEWQLVWDEERGGRNSSRFPRRSAACRPSFSWSASSLESSSWSRGFERAPLSSIRLFSRENLNNQSVRYERRSPYAGPATPHLALKMCSCLLLIHAPAVRASG